MEARESLVLDAYQSVSECKRVCLKDEVRSDVRKSTVACEPCCPPWINAAGGALGATIPQAWTRADPCTRRAPTQSRMLQAERHPHSHTHARYTYLTLSQDRETERADAHHVIRTSPANQGTDRLSQKPGLTSSGHPDLRA